MQAGRQVVPHHAAAPWLQVDGCGNTSYYDQGYRTMGQALESSGRSIVYSCSWPAYLGDDETTKPFAEMISDGCNLWCVSFVPPSTDSHSSAHTHAYPFTHARSVACGLVLPRASRH